MIPVKITSRESIKEKLKSFTGSRIGTFKRGDKIHNFKYNVVNGEVETFAFDRTIGEMIASDETQDYFLKEVYLEIELGRDNEPILYKPLYETLTDPNFPQVFKAIWMQEGRVVFLEHIEGDEIKFGTRYAEEGDTANIITHAGGFEYTEDMVVYNQTFNMQMLNRAMGESHNMLLNHLHFYPIISYGYTSANQTPASTEYDTPAQPDWSDWTRKVMNTRKTLIDAVEASRLATPSRKGSKLVIHPSNEQLITDALGNIQVSGEFPTNVVGIDEVIAYDGASITVGAKTYTYTGCPTTKAYLVMPRKYMKELIKHDLRVDADNADLSRLIEQQLVGRSRRGVYAGTERSVQEITLPT